MEQTQLVAATQGAAVSADFTLAQGETTVIIIDSLGAVRDTTGVSVQPVCFVKRKLITPNKYQSVAGDSVLTLAQPDVLLIGPGIFRIEKEETEFPIAALRDT